MGTLIHGIGAGEQLDSSGERVNIENMDISSLVRDGTFNWEHKGETSSQIVGKILKAQKILKEEDCQDKYQLYFWRKAGEYPYLYVMGELFDEDGHQAAKDLAAIFRYDKRTQDSRPDGVDNVVGFSVEGHRLEDNRDGVVPGSIARKVTVTVWPCNKSCIAEILEDGVQENRVPNIVEKAMSKSETPYIGDTVGSTKSGRAIPMGVGHDYSDWSAADHRDAANAHYGKFEEADRPKEKMAHLKHAKTHMKYADRAMKLGKALTAGSANVAPGNLSDGAALHGENLEKEVYASWGKKEEFELWAKQSMPGVSQKNVDELGKLIAIAEYHRAEEALRKVL